VNQNEQLDEAIVDAERAAELSAMADRALAQIDVDREMEQAEIERQLMRQLADLERETAQ
jgi:hypothetical protein